MARQLQRLLMLTAAVSLAAGASTEDVPKQNMVAFFNGGCEEHICEWACVPWNGGYVCDCPKGRSLRPNGFSCSDLPLEGYETVSPEVPSQTSENVKLQQDEVYIPPRNLPIGQSQPTDSNQSKQSQSSSKKIPDSDTSQSESGKADKISDHVINEFENRTRDDHQYFSYDLRSGMPDPAELIQTEQESHLRVEKAPVQVGESDVVSIKVERPPPECQDFVCRNGGQCSVADGKPRCDCPLGTRGKRCGKDVDIRFPKFSGSGYLAFPVLRNAYKEFTITVQFKPQTTDGLLLFSSERDDANGDFFSIALVDGKVDFRFDCGTGMAVFHSVTNVTLREWNTVWVQRVDSHGWLKLNTEMPIEGEAKGNYTRITLREDLYLGGYRHMDKVGTRVGTDVPFVGCVQELWVNSYKYDMRRGGKVGDAIHGLNVDECSHNICGEVNCENGGQCVARSADRHVCLCPLGTGSALCEKKVTVHVPSFNGHSYLQYAGLSRTTLTYTEIEVVFKPQRADGLILYNGYTEDRKGDFIALVMRAGHVEFTFDLGTGPAVLRSREPVSLGTWHVVRVYRTGMDGVLYVDKQEPVEGLSKGAYTQLTLLLPLFVGGHADYDAVSKHVNISESFTGCIQKVVINEKPLKLIAEAVDGINVDNCDHPCVGSPCVNGGECVVVLGDYVCHCPLGYTNTNCEDIVAEPISVPRFEGSGYLRYSNPDIIKRVVGKKIDIQMNMRATAEDGLLFWSGQEPFTSSSDYLALGFNDGYLEFRFNLGSGEVVIKHNSSQLFDGAIHSLRAQRDGRDAYLSIDGTEIYEGSSPGRYKYLNTNMQLFLGGMPDVAHNTRRIFTAGLSGCIYKLVLATDYEVNLIGQAETGQNVQQCP